MYICMRLMVMMRVKCTCADYCFQYCDIVWSAR